MKPLWEELQDGITYTASADVMALIRACRAERIAREWLTDNEGRITAKLSAVSEAVGAFIGLHAVAHRARTVAVTGRHFEPVTATAQPVPPMMFIASVEDIRGRVARHHEDTVRRDELTRLRTRDEYEASKRTAKTPTKPAVSEAPPAPASEPAAVVPARGRHMRRQALIDANRPRWDTIERDLKDGAENGLSAAARSDKHAFWWEGSALKWAEENGKLRAPAGQALNSIVHRLQG